MGRKKKKHKEEDEEELGLPSPLGLGEKTRQWIYALVSFAGMLFFVLSALGKAGIVGTMLLSSLSSLFGLGYYLFPLVFLLLGVTLVRQEKHAPMFTFGGMTLFFLSGLGMIEIFLKNGGIAGRMLAEPLLAFLDVYASSALLVTLFLISLLLVTNFTPSFAWVLRLFRKKEGGDEEAVEEEPPEEQVDVSSVNESPAEPIKKLISLATSARNILSLKDQYTHLALNYKNPPFDLLLGDRGKPGVGDIKANANIIKRTLQNFGINVEMDEVSVGPSVTRYALKPAQGVKLARIVGLKNDLSLSLAARPLRIEAPIPGRSLVGIEIPNKAVT